MADPRLGNATVVETFITSMERAKRHRISHRTDERQRLDGSGPPFVKIGRRVLYKLSDLEEWEAKRTFRSTSEVDQDTEGSVTSSDAGNVDA